MTTATTLIATILQQATVSLIYVSSSATNTYNSDPKSNQPPKQEPVPLQNVDYKVIMNGALAEVTITQVYQNPLNEAINLDYKFPISNKLAFSKLWAEYKNTIVQGQVKAKEQAKKEFEENKNAGNTVAYSDIYASTRDVMRLQLANFPANEKITIHLSYSLELDVASYSQWSLRIPSTLTPRYVNNWNQYPDAEQAKQHYPSYVYYTSKNQYPWTISVTINWPNNIKALSSPTHSGVVSIIKNQNTATIQFDSTKGPQYPDKDFVALLEDSVIFESGVKVVKAVNVKSTNSAFPKYGAVLQFVPDFYKWNVQGGNYQFTNPNFATEESTFLMSTTKAEFIFVLDRSGSMSGQRMTNANKALMAFLNNLPQNSYFNVISFGSNYNFLFPSSVINTAANINSATSKIEGYTADMGGTQILEPVIAGADLPPIDKYQRLIFLLTDGAISNTEYFLKVVFEKFFYSQARMFSIGIGSGVSQYLVQQSAIYGNGESLIISDNNDPTSRILDLLKRSLSPSLTNFQLTYDSQHIAGIAPMPNTKSHITRGYPFMMYVLFKNELFATATKQTTLTLDFYDSADNTVKSRSFLFDLNLAIDDDGPFKLFTKNYLDDVLRNHANSFMDPFLPQALGLSVGDKFYTELAVGYQVVHSNYTALICVISENGQVANKTIEVPNHSPSDYGYGGSSSGSNDYLIIKLRHGIILILLWFMSFNV